MTNTLYVPTKSETNNNSNTLKISMEYGNHSIFIGIEFSLQTIWKKKLTQIEMLFNTILDRKLETTKTSLEKTKNINQALIRETKLKRCKLFLKSQNNNYSSWEKIFELKFEVRKKKKWFDELLSSNTSLDLYCSWNFWNKYYEFDCSLKPANLQ